MAVAAVLGLLAVPADAGSKYGQRIDTAKASGDYAIAQASGTARRPRAIYVVVRSAPGYQKISGAWSMICSKGFGAGSKSGRVRGTTPHAQRLRMPSSRPDDCSVAANAQLEEGGKVKVSIYKK